MASLKTTKTHKNKLSRVLKRHIKVVKGTKKSLGKRRYKSRSRSRSSRSRSRSRKH